MTMALDARHHAGQPGSVSKPGLRILRGFRQHRTRPDFGRADSSGEHQLSEEITISHEQPRLTWVGGLFVFSESE